MGGFVFSAEEKEEEDHDSRHSCKEEVKSVPKMICVGGRPLASMRNFINTNWPTLNKTTKPDMTMTGSDKSSKRTTLLFHGISHKLDNLESPL